MGQGHPLDLNTTVSRASAFFSLQPLLTEIIYASDFLKTAGVYTRTLEMKIQHLLAWISLLKFQSTSLEHTLLLSVHIAIYSYMWIILARNSQEYAIIHPFWTISWNSPMLKKICVSISKPNLLKTVSVLSQRNITNWMHTKRNKEGL